MSCRVIVSMLATVAVLGCNTLTAHSAPFMIVGDDEKVAVADGKTIILPPGKDSVLIVDVANPLDPKIVVNLPLKNSVVGPPVNLAIDPTNSVAIIADSMNAVQAATIGNRFRTTKSMSSISRPNRPSSSAQYRAISSRPVSRSIRPAISR